MRTLFQLAICVCLVILAGGTIHYIHDHPSFGGGVLLLIAWCAIIGLIVTTMPFGLWDKDKARAQIPAPANERMNELERRLTDIQDVVILIDEKLSRIDRQEKKMPESESK